MAIVNSTCHLCSNLCIHYCCRLLPLSSGFVENLLSKCVYLSQVELRYAIRRRKAYSRETCQIITLIESDYWRHISVYVTQIILAVLFPTVQELMGLRLKCIRVYYSYYYKTSYPVFIFVIIKTSPNHTTKCLLQ